MTNYEKASEALYHWACGDLTTGEAKSECFHHGFDIDFRQADIGAFMTATRTWDGATVEIEI